MRSDAGGGVNRIQVVPEGRLHVDMKIPADGILESHPDNAAVVDKFDIFRGAQLFPAPAFLEVNAVPYQEIGAESPQKIESHPLVNKTVPQYQRDLQVLEMLEQFTFLHFALGFFPVTPIWSVGDIHGLLLCGHIGGQEGIILSVTQLDLPR